jgi:purine nucleoside phosphorylase
MGDALQRLRDWNAETAIILGSGLNSIIPADSQAIPYAQFQELPQTSVPGHVGQFVLSKIDNVPVIFAQRRVHLFWGAHAPSRAGDGDSPSRTFPKYFGEGAEMNTRGACAPQQKLGADAVAVSTALEVIQARALGVEAAGFSCLTNLAAGISKEKLSHDEVLETGKKAAQDFALLLNSFF